MVFSLHTGNQMAKLISIMVNLCNLPGSPNKYMVFFKEIGKIQGELDNLAFKHFLYKTIFTVFG